MLGSSHEEPGTAEPALALMHEVGAALREARGERGKEILDVAEILRIQPSYLAALEQGDLSAIPGRTYALGFLRSYAQYLGFDGDDLIAQIRSSVGLAGGAALHGRAPLTEGRLPKIPILVVSLAVLAGAYAGWAYVDGNGAAPELVEEVPEDLREEARSLFEAGVQATPPAPARAEASDALPPPAAAVSGPAPGSPEPIAAPPLESEGPVAAPNASPRAEPQASLPLPADRESPLAGLDPVSERAVTPETDLSRKAASGGPAAPVLAAPEADRASEAALEGQAVPALAAVPEADLADQADLVGQAAPAYRSALAPRAQPPEVDAPARRPRVYGTELPESRVVLRARGSAWVHVSSTNNDYLWVQTLRPGDRFIVPARPDLVLWTGNAGGVEVLVDGALLPSLGPDAVVVRDVSLQPRALLRRLLPLPDESAGVSDLASAAKPPMMPPSSR